MHGGDIYRNKVKLDFSVNLNPLGPPREVLAALHASIDRAGDYPDERQEAVREAISQYERVEPCCIAAGCGASQLILAAVRAAAPKSAVVFEPSFSGYAYALGACGCKARQVMLGEAAGFALTWQDLEGLKDHPDLVFVCDPANPVGNNTADEVLQELLDLTRDMGTRVILDESFLLLSRKVAEGVMRSRAEWIRRNDHLYIIRSLTKLFALPGIRMGYVMSAPENISRIMGQLPEWNLPVTAEGAIIAGMKVLEETDYLARSQEMIAEERDYLAKELRTAGLQVVESDAPYLLFRGPDTLYDDLLSRGILIRDCSDFTGLSKGTYRIAVREHAACEIFCETLREVLYEA